MVLKRETTGNLDCRHFECNPSRRTRLLRSTGQSVGCKTRLYRRSSGDRKAMRVGGRRVRRVARGVGKQQSVDGLRRDRVKKRAIAASSHCEGRAATRTRADLLG